jgi:hypothetical protein
MRRKTIPLWIALFLAYGGLAGPEWIATRGIPGMIGLILLWYGHRWLLRRFGQLSPARLAFIWGLATAAVWGGVVLYLGLEPDLDDPLNWLAFAIVLGVFLWSVLFLSLGSWMVLGTRGASSVLAAGLVAPLICAWVIGMLVIVNGLVNSELVQREEIARYDTGPRSVYWPRPLPGDWDFIVLSPDDANPGREGSAYDRLADAVVPVRNGEQFGTAFLITKDGLAITNHHVIDGEPPFFARLAEGDERRLRVVRWHEEVDAALLQIDCPDDCPTVELGWSEPVALGSDVIVIGTPLTPALGRTVTRGVLSGRRFMDDGTALQYDAPVNPGNSGGPIIDPESGRVIGIVTSKIVDEAYEGLGFGMAIEDVLRVLGVRR